MTTFARYPHLAARIFNTPLLIHPEKLDAIVHGLAPRFGLDLEPLAYDTQSVRREPAGYRVENGVALIDIFGVLTHRTTGLSPDSSVLQSYQDLSAQLKQALDDPQVRSIVLQIDSPGGEVGGVFQLAEQIAQSKTIKPIHAVASELATSAAYLIASAASSISMSETAQVGSIGVVMRHVDVSEAMANEGVKVTYIYAGDHKIDGNPHQPITDAVRAKYQEQVDYYYDLFVNTVARNRNLNPESVRATQAGMFTYYDAKRWGLVDQLATVDQLIVPSNHSLSLNSSSMESAMDVEELQTQFNDLSAKYLSLESEVNHERSAHAQVVTDLQNLLDCEVAQSKLLQERAESLEAELQQLKTDTRLNAVKSLFDEVHLEYSDEKAKPYLEMSETIFLAVADDLRTMKPVVKSDWFKEIAVSGKSEKTEHDYAAQLFAQVAGGK